MKHKRAILLLLSLLFFGVISTVNPAQIPPTQNKLGAIIFSSQRDSNQEIYLLDLATGLQTNLTQNGAEDGYPRWSPNGQNIAFATNRDGYWEIYLANPDGSGQRNLTKNRGGNGYMDWSPDSQSLVFASTRNGEKKNDLYIIRADGSGLKRLANHPAEDVHPAWSPNGRRIAFASERDGNRQIYIVNIDGTNLVRLTSNRGYDDYPAWSPDGSQIAFASDRDSRSSDKLDVYVMNSDGTNVRRLVAHSADDRHPTWSPDGKMLAFTSDRNGNRDIFIINIDGTGLKRVVSAPGNDEHPHWNASSTGAENITPDPTVGQGNSSTNWLDISRGKTAGKFRFAQDRRLLYAGRPLTGFKFRSSVEQIKISPTAVNDKYAICITFDDNNSEAFLLKLDSYTGAKLDIGVPLEWAAWSPAGNYVVVGSYYEADSELYVVSISPTVTRKIPFQLGAKKNREGFPLEEVKFDLDKFVWVNPQTFRVLATIHCNAYNDAACTDGKWEKVLRGYNVDVDATTLSTKNSPIPATPTAPPNRTPESPRAQATTPKPSPSPSPAKKTVGQSIKDGILEGLKAGTSPRGQSTPTPTPRNTGRTPQPSSGPATSPATGYNPDPSLPINQQAQAVAEAFWNSRMTKCGDDYFAASYNDYYQFKGVTFALSPQPIREVDQLNGLEFNGGSILLGRAYRMFSNGTWGQWSEGPKDQMHSLSPSSVYAISVSKRNGKWDVATGGMGSPVFYMRKPDCSQIPGGAPAAAATPKQAPTVTPIEPRGPENWNTFWGAFRKAVQTKDRTAIRNMMSEKFEWAADGNITRDEALRNMDQMKLWEGLQNAVIKEPVLCKKPYCGNRPGYRVWSSARYKVEVMFEQDANGRWHWSALLGD